MPGTKRSRAQILRKAVYRLLCLVLLLVALGLVGGTMLAAEPPVIGALAPDYALISALGNVRREWRNSRTTRRVDP